MQVSWIDVDNLNALLAKITPQEEITRETEPPQALVPAGKTVATPEDDFMGGSAPVPSLEAALQALEPPPVALIEPSPPVSCDPPAGVSESLANGVAETPAPQAASAAALPLSRIRDKLRSIRQRASAAGMLGKPLEKASPSTTPDISPPLPSPAPPSFAPPTGDLQERLAAFALWARQLLHADGGHVLVMNDDGELLWGGEAKAGLVLSAMMAWSARVRGSAHAAYARLPILRQALASGHMLTVVPCETSNGMLFHAAVAAPGSFSDEVAEALRKALSQTMEGHTEEDNGFPSQPASIKAGTAPAH